MLSMFDCQKLWRAWNLPQRQVNNKHVTSLPRFAHAGRTQETLGSETKTPFIPRGNSSSQSTGICDQSPSSNFTEVKSRPSHAYTPSRLIQETNPTFREPKPFITGSKSTWPLPYKPRWKGCLEHRHFAPLFMRHVHELSFPFKTSWSFSNICSYFSLIQKTEAAVEKNPSVINTKNCRCAGHPISMTTA